ncbi:hypothetical protein GCM10009682_15190 [Luedemannella flava]|uniref:Uncharacterized protein n=1 Tax=Luedemannella flava TaxID=349316 RepID=A0ABP4XZ41_9ACTN
METKSSVDALTERVTTFEQGVERRIDEVAAAVSSRLAQESDQDLAAFDSLAGAPSRAAVLEALVRAVDMGLIRPWRGPRVLVSEGFSIFVRVDYDEDPDPFHGEEEITFVVEELDGSQLESVTWDTDLSVDDVMVRLGRAIQRHTSREVLDVRTLFAGIRDALVVASTHPSRRPILQLCPPQWAITDTGVVSYGKSPLYEVSARKLRADSHMENHVGAKTWVDRDSWEGAYVVACALDWFDDKPEPAF